MSLDLTHCTRGMVGAALLSALFGSGLCAAADVPGRGDQTPIRESPEREKEKAEAAKELQVPPPRYPRDRDLAEIKLRNPTPNKFYIDASTISVAKDQIVRFVMVIRTPGNETNVRYSGLRCSNREWKDYAFGTSDKGWQEDGSAKWSRIIELNYNNYQDTLYTDYFCAVGVISSGPVGDARKLANLLRHPQMPDPRVPQRSIAQ